MTNYRAAAPMVQPPNPTPPRVHEADPERRLDQAFGWMAGAGIFAGTCVVGGMALLLANLPDVVGIAVAAAGTAGAIVLEVVRRKTAMSLVVADDRIAVYRNGVLATVIPPQQLAPYHLQGVNTYRQMTGFFMLAFFGICGTLVGLGSGMTGAALLGIGFLVGPVLGVTSAVYTRGKCRHYNVGTQRGWERVMFRERDLHRVAMAVRWFSVG